MERTKITIARKRLGRCVLLVPPAWAWRTCNPATAKRSPAPVTTLAPRKQHASNRYHGLNAPQLRSLPE